MQQTRDPKHFAEQLRARTRQFALGVILLCRRFPRTVDGYVLAKQLIRAATSTAANYRACCRSRSASDFVSKMSVVCEEADESEFWLELAIAASLSMESDAEARDLLAEASELVALFTKSRETAKRNIRQRAGL